MRLPSRLETLQLAGALTLLAGVMTIVYALVTRHFGEIALALLLLGIGGAVVYASGRWANRAEGALRQRLRVMRAAITRFRTENGRDPASLRELAESGYLDGVPTDPIRWPSRRWDEVRSGSGITDVRSLSASPALDDTTYCTW